MVPFSLPESAQAQGKLDFSSGGSLLYHLREDLLHNGSGKTAPAQERPELLPAFDTIGFTSQAWPASRGLRPRRCQHIPDREILLHSVLDKGAANAALLQLLAQPLRAIAAAGETRGEIGVRIGRIIEDTAVLEARDDLVHYLVRHPAPAQLLPDFVGCTRTGRQVLERGCLGRQELLSSSEVCLVFHAQLAPYPQVPLAHEFL
jgi:hypothetical protein